MRKCNKCSKEYPLADFVDADSGKLNPRAKTCYSCRITKHNNIGERMLLNDYISSVILIKSFQISDPINWIDKVNFAVYSGYLRYKEQACLYCGTDFRDKFSKESGGIIQQTANVEHMNPLEQGGDNSLRNLAISCGVCNSKKARSRFDIWLNKLDEPYKSNARSYYIKRQSYEPEEFKDKSIPTKREVLTYPDFSEYLDRLIIVNELAVKFNDRRVMRIIEKSEADEFDQFKTHTFDSIVANLILFPWEC